MNKNSVLNPAQTTFLVLLRIFIGWHLMYEGIAKLLIPEWTSEAFLLNSKWILAPFFHALASTDGLMSVVDILNIWGLILIGLSLMLGFRVRFAAIAGMLLLALYYLANPPFIGKDFGIPTEGHYLYINKTLIEIVALGLLAVFPSGRHFGLDRLLRFNIRKKKDHVPESVNAANASMQNNENGSLPFRRRELLRYLAMVPVLGVFGLGATRKYRWNSVNAVSGATIKPPETSLTDLTAPAPHGTILDKKVSRIIAGGNLIGGWSHSRDLHYVSKLFKAYNNEKKVFETLVLAQKAGINTINISSSQLPLINKYKRIFGSSLQAMTQIHPTRKDVYGIARQMMEDGADFIQIQGNCCDWKVRDGEVDVIAACIDYIKEQGYPAGLGAHSVQALQACEDAGIKADFFMKTFHHDKYWSAHPPENRIPFSVDGPRSNNHDEFHDNMFCLFPEETAEFMKRQQIPWIAFKVLAGGAIKPEDGFRYAFENGADFICVGMFDWQIVEDVNQVHVTLKNLPNRNREWFG